jgi:hypothetical protein
MELVKKKPYLVDHVVGVLLPQLQKFLVQDEEDNVSNLNMHDCVEEMSGNVKEPIGNLLRSIVYCLSIFNQNTEFQNEPEIFSNVLCAKKILESLATWLSSSELDDFGVDKSSDFESLQTLQLAKLLGGVYEVFLEYIVIITTFSSSIWAKRFLTLSERKQLLGDLIKEHGKAPKGRKVPTAGNDDKSTLLTLRFSIPLLRVVGDKISEGCTFDRASCTLLFGDTQCMGMVLHTVFKQVLEKFLFLIYLS